MVLDMARHGKYKKSIIKLGMRGRDAVGRSTLKENILQVFTIDFSEIRESQLAIGWTEQECKEWDELAQENHTYHLTPEEKKRYQGQWYLSLHKACKNGLWNFDLIFEPLSRWKIVYTTNQENKLKSVSIQINKDDGIHLQAHRGGTSLNGIGSELIKLF